MDDTPELIAADLIAHVGRWGALTYIAGLWWRITVAVVRS